VSRRAAQTDDEVAPSVADTIRDRMSTLRPAERKVARTLLADYPSAGLSTVGALATRAAVSGPSVVRFANAVGFGGFSALQAQLRAELTRASTGPLARATWQPDAGSHSELLVRQATDMSRLALDSLAAIPPADLDAAIELLSATSRRLYLAGGRFTRLLAEYLALHLEQVRPKVRYLPDPLGVDLGQLLDVGRRDIYLLIDVTRYQRSIVELAAAVRKRGATIVLITDEQLSPAAADADVVLPTAVTSPSPFYSAAAAFMLAELLVVPVMHRLGNAARTRMATWDDHRAHELLQP
jgi:DNA-binding MurR/RpiR family transcriptional regulator